MIETEHGWWVKHHFARVHASPGLVRLAQRAPTRKKVQGRIVGPKRLVLEIAPTAPLQARLLAVARHCRHLQPQYLE